MATDEPRNWLVSGDVLSTVTLTTTETLEPAVTPAGNPSAHPVISFAAVKGATPLYALTVKLGIDAMSLFWFLARSTALRSPLQPDVAQPGWFDKRYAPSREALVTRFWYFAIRPRSIAPKTSMTSGTSTIASSRIAVPR